ncbi:hypothetical protein DXG01_001516 [Tephrocybe rancida]|nr:hypothetical protein DXG01_001516 [Tephrocybe rancida]
MLLKFPQFRRRYNGPRFPQEILELIIQFCASETQRSWCLASSSLRLPAQRALFHTVTIFLHPKSAGTHYGNLDEFLTSNPRIASYVYHLRLCIYSTSLPRVQPHLSGLRTLTLFSYHTIDWRALPAPFTSALYTLLKAPKMCCLVLGIHITHFPLPSALSLTHLAILGYHNDITMPQIPPEEPNYLQTLRVESYKILCTFVDFPQFLSLSRLVHFDVIAYLDASLVIIQHIIDHCAPTLQDLHLRWGSDGPSFPQLSLALLTSLTNLTITLLTSSSLHWCTQALSTLPSLRSPGRPGLALTLHVNHFPRYNKYIWNRHNYVHLWAQIDTLPIHALHIHREDYPQVGGGRDDEPTLEVLFPTLSMRKALVGPPPPPTPTPTRSLWKRLLRGSDTGERGKKDSSGPVEGQVGPGSPSPRNCAGLVGRTWDEKMREPIDKETAQ